MEAILPTLVLGSQEGKRWVATRQTDTQTHIHHPVCPVKLCDSTIMPSLSLKGLGRGRVKYPFKLFQISERQGKTWRIFWGGDWSNLDDDPALPTGPLSSILVTRFGCRPVMLAGGLLASAGMILASFASRLLELYLTAGVLTGEGTHVSPCRSRESLLQVSQSPVFLKGAAPESPSSLFRFRTYPDPGSAWPCH